MKKIFITAFILSVFYGTAQVRMTGTGITSSNSSAFIDASSNTTNNGTVGTGKGLVFPRVDLATFTFVGSTGVASNFPSRFDGMIVYNTAVSGVAGSGSTEGSLTPGFWFYENKSTSVSGGTWKPLGSGVGGAIKDITPIEIALNTKVNGVQLYAIAGSFTADGITAAVTITKPVGMSGYYAITVYKDGKTYRNQIISFDTGLTTNNVYTGSGPFTEVYPAGTYNYVLEYFK